MDWKEIERYLWSDIDGYVFLPIESLKLPRDTQDSRWVWGHEWQVEVTPLTSNEGWKFATDFKGSFKPDKQIQHLVRRRKWIRKCYKELKETAQPNSNQIK